VASPLPFPKFFVVAVASAKLSPVPPSHPIPSHSSSLIQPRFIILELFDFALAKLPSYSLVMLGARVVAVKSGITNPKALGSLLLQAFLLIVSLLFLESSITSSNFILLIVPRQFLVKLLP
jgi:hypothetical protein